MTLSFLITGAVQLELVSADLSQMLILLNSAGIELFGFHQKDALTGSFWISRREYEKAAALCRNTNCSIRVKRHMGFFWTAKKLMARPVLVLGLVGVLLLYWLLPAWVLFIKVEGNDSVPDRQVLEAAEECGLSFGTVRRAIRSEKIKNHLLQQIPQLKWVGVNTRGCVATVLVREGAEEPRSEPAHRVGNIVALRDGYILSASATKGNLLVQPGQTVKTGQLLISGYTDCGISIRAEMAEGEIYAQTVRTISVVSPAEAEKISGCKEMKKKISLLLGKKRIFLWKDSGISEVSCGRMYEEYYITLPGGFSLPVALCIERLMTYETAPVSDPAADLSKELERYAGTYLTGQMSAGEILRATVRASSGEDIVCIDGSYLCREMIGRVQLEQIGETDGKDSGTDRKRGAG